MEPLPPRIVELALLEWPAPNPDGTTTITAATLRQVQALLNVMVNYLQIQLERCGE